MAPGSRVPLDVFKVRVADIGRDMNNYLDPPGSGWEDEAKDLFLSSLEEYEKKLTE